MADTVRRVQYYHMTVPDTPAEGQRILFASKNLVPVRVVLNTDAALVGAALFAQDALCPRPHGRVNQRHPWRTEDAIA